MSEFKPSLQTRQMITGLLGAMLREFPRLLGIDELIASCEVTHMDPEGVGVFPRYIRARVHRYQQEVYYRGGLGIGVGSYVTVIHFQQGDRYEVFGTSGATGTLTIELEALADYDRGYMIRGGLYDWEAFDASTLGAVLIGDGVDVISDPTPTFVGVVTMGAGLTLNGASGANIITVPDNVAQAAHIVDAGGADDYLTVVSTDAQRELVVNQDAADIDFRVEGVGQTHALFVQGSDGYVGIGHSAPTVNLHAYSTGTGTTILSENANAAGAAVVCTYMSPAAGGAVTYLLSYGSTYPGALFGANLADASALISVDASILIIGNYSNTDLILGTNNLERMRIYAAGDVQIVTGGLYIGADCYLYRAGGNTFRTPDTLVVDTKLCVQTTDVTCVLNVIGTGASDFIVSFGKIQGANSTGFYWMLGGGAAGLTVRGYMGITKTGAGGDTLFTGETADYVGIRCVNGLHMGIGATIVWTMNSSMNIGIGTGALTPLAKLHVDQASLTGAIPPLYLDQGDVSEEMIEFATTIGVGNAIEAVGAKSLTTTHFIKVTLPGALTRYIPVGTIA